jgi:mono/diheme cytochrome c family protein
MKHFKYILFVSMLVAMTACSDVQRKPGSIYMPDMAYSRAYETYAERDTAVFTTNEKEMGTKIFFDNLPVRGAMARNGQVAVWTIAQDANGDTANYFASRAVPNPMPLLNKKDSIEAERLYLINCGICHGTKLDGNGPLYKDGAGPYPAAPKNLITLNMPDGQMFYSIQYGKNKMGSYASQLTVNQRWAIIHYINLKKGLEKTAETGALVAAKEVVEPVVAPKVEAVRDTAAKKTM